MNSKVQLFERYRPSKFFEACLKGCGDHGHAGYRGLGYVPNDAKTKVTIIRYHTRIADVTQDKVVFYPSQKIAKGELSRACFPLDVDFRSAGKNATFGKMVTVTIEKHEFKVRDGSELVIDLDGFVHTEPLPTQTINKTKARELRVKVQEFFEAAWLSAKVLGRQCEHSGHHWHEDYEFLDALYENTPATVCHDTRFLWKHNWAERTYVLVEKAKMKGIVDRFINRNKHTLYEKHGVLE